MAKAKPKINTTPEVKVLNLKDINPDPGNPREITGEALSGLKNSLMIFGCVELIIVNKRTMKIISGHQRFRALKQLGVKMAGCILLDLSDKDSRLLNITMNDDAIRGQWTKQILEILDDMEVNQTKEFEDLKMNLLRNEISHLDVENIDKRISESRNNIMDGNIQCPKCGVVLPEVQFIGSQN